MESGHCVRAVFARLQGFDNCFLSTWRKRGVSRDRMIYIYTGPGRFSGMARSEAYEGSPVHMYKIRSPYGGLILYIFTGWAPETSSKT